MKKVFALTVVLLVVFSFGCSREIEPPETREQLQQRTDSQIAEFNQRIEEARVRVDGLSGDSREEMNQSINSLEEQRDDLAAKLQAVREASDDEWRAIMNDVEEASNELEKDFDDFQRAFEEVFSQF